MAGSKTPVISVLIGEGGSGGALALAVADRVWILENAVYSVISPEGCASILWKDSKKVKDAADCLRLTAQDMMELGVVEQVIPEEKDFSQTYSCLKEQLESTLSQLCALPVEELLEQRLPGGVRKFVNKRFRECGKPHFQKPVKRPAQGTSPASLFLPLRERLTIKSQGGK